MQTIPIILPENIENNVSGENLHAKGKILYSNEKPILFSDRRVILKTVGPISPTWLRLFSNQDEINIAQLTAAFPERANKSGQISEVNFIDALSKIKHDNIQQMFGIILNPLALVMEHPLDSGSLVLKRDLDYATIRYLLIDISMALLYLESIGISIPYFNISDVLLFREPTITAKLSILDCGPRFRRKPSDISLSQQFGSPEAGGREAGYFTLSNLNITPPITPLKPSPFKNLRYLHRSDNKSSNPPPEPSDSIQPQPPKLASINSHIPKLYKPTNSIQTQTSMNQRCAQIRAPLRSQKDKFQIPKIPPWLNYKKCGTPNLPFPSWLSRIEHRSRSQVTESFRDFLMFLLEGEDCIDIPPLFHYLVQNIPDSIVDCILILNHIDPFHECTEMDENFIIALKQQTEEYGKFYSDEYKNLFPEELGESGAYGSAHGEFESNSKTW